MAPAKGRGLIELLHSLAGFALYLIAFFWLPAACCLWWIVSMRQDHRRWREGLAPLDGEHQPPRRSQVAILAAIAGWCALGWALFTHLPEAIDPWARGGIGWYMTDV